MSGEDWIDKADEWVTKKAKEILTEVKNELIPGASKPVPSEEEPEPDHGTARMGNIDGKDVPEMLAVSAVDIPATSPNPDSILRGLPDYGKALLKLDPTQFAFKEEPPPKPKPLPPPPPPPPPPVKQEVKKDNDALVGVVVVVLGVLGFFGYKAMSKPDYKDSSVSASKGSSTFDSTSSSVDDTYKRAIAGDAEAQFKIGNTWKFGASIATTDEKREENLTIARNFYTRAAEQGHAGAKRALEELKYEVKPFNPAPPLTKP